MDLETFRLLTGHIENDEPVVSLVIHEIAGALAAQPALDLSAFKTDIHERAAREPEAAPCLERLLEELETLRPH